MRHARHTLSAALCAVWIFATAGFAANPYIQEKNGLTILKAELPTCTAAREGHTFSVRNCVSVGSCATTADPGFVARMTCDYTGSEWAYRLVNATIAAADAGDYVTKTTAATQTITVTGAGNDLVLTTAASGDDVIVNVGDALAIATGGAAGLTTTDGTITWTAAGSGRDHVTIATDDISDASNDYVGAFVATWGVTAPAATLTASTSTLVTTPKLSVSGVYEEAVTNVTVADDGAGTKPAGAIPITTNFATCTCNDATGCAMTIAEPTPTAGYGRLLVVASIGTGNCEIADSSGVVELGTTLVVEPTSTATFAYVGAAWHNLASKDNVP